MAKGENYVDGSAYGEAPMGPQPQGQPAGAVWPGNPSLNIDRRDDTPGDRSIRVDALYRTIESREHSKEHAGERMAARFLYNK